MRYAIADYLTREQKERAVAEEYAGIPPVNKKGLDPLGVALGFRKMPTGEEVVSEILYLRQDRNRSKDVLADAAWGFLFDFDVGKIQDLSVALGLKEGA